MKLNDFEYIQLSFMKLVISLLMNLISDDLSHRQNALMDGASFVRNIDESIKNMRFT